MGYLLYFFIFMMLSRVLMFSPIFGILIYGFLFYSIYASIRRRQAAQQQYQQYYQQKQQQQSSSQQSQDSAQSQANNKVNENDVFDAEYTEEDV